MKEVKPSKRDNTFSILNTSGTDQTFLSILAFLYLSTAIATLYEMILHFRFWMQTGPHSHTTKIIRGFRVFILLCASWVMIHKGFLMIFGFKTESVEYIYPTGLVTWNNKIYNNYKPKNDKKAGKYAHHTNTQFIMSGLLFSVLVLLLTPSSYLFYRIILKINANVRSDSRVKTFMVLIFFNSVVFLVRATFDFFNAITHVFLDWTLKSDTAFFSVYFTCMILFEIIPAIVLVLAFHLNITSEMSRTQSIIVTSPQYINIETDEESDD
ncbi:hypothetical protein M0811_03842 [Anaeramoeba ignava]|uniref:Uncharacterized protein n=1 Tax=Anaeramoeba ignava TaxID=1746090 RepID=A0A9Q0LWN6_ANAIG|nr:hypothetical protein M0811_03842 [Anaeramoeba ignava]